MSTGSYLKNGPPGQGRPAVTGAETRGATSSTLLLLLLVCEKREVLACELSKSSRWPPVWCLPRTGFGGFGHVWNFGWKMDRTTDGRRINRQTGLLAAVLFRSLFLLVHLFPRSQ